MTCIFRKGWVVCFVLCVLALSGCSAVSNFKRSPASTNLLKPELGMLMGEPKSGGFVLEVHRPILISEDESPNASSTATIWFSDGRQISPKSSAEIPETACWLRIHLAHADFSTAVESGKLPSFRLNAGLLKIMERSIAASAEYPNKMKVNSIHFEILQGGGLSYFGNNAASESKVVFLGCQGRDILWDDLNRAFGPGMFSIYSHLIE